MPQFRSVGVMVLLVVLIVGICFCPAALAQDDEYQPLGPDDLQQLVAPIALYPDAILAQVLVAATYPDDVIAADQWLAAGNNPAGIDDQGWDLSVKGVARFPNVLHYMASNSDWMDDLGDAFINQQGDVMDAVQALRSQALANGSLVSNDQQQVVVMGSTIEIIPADPNTIYLPIYDPATVYEEPDVEPGTVIEPRIRWGPPIHCGPWLHHDVDWHDRAVYIGDWGVDRPWWRHDPHGGKLDYTHDRPGIFHQSDHIAVKEHNQTINYPAGRWNRADHDPKKPLPKIEPHPGGHLPDVKSGKKYPPRITLHPEKANAAKEANGPLNYGSSPDAARASERGKESRSAKTPPTPARPEPVKSDQPAARQEARKPTEEKPVEEKPAEEKKTEPDRHALPKEESHPAPSPSPKSPPKEESKPAPKQESKPAPAPQRNNQPSGGVMSGYQRGDQAGADSQRGAQSRGAAKSPAPSPPPSRSPSPPPSRSPSPPPERSPSPPPSKRGK